MPIVVHVADDSSLDQGDVLRDVPFLVVGIDGNPAFDKEAPYALVVSRPCKALRDDVVVLAPVVPFPLDLAEISKAPGGLDRTRRYVAGLRDGIKGGDFSDALYMGAFEDGSTRRYAAQFTTLCTTRVPVAAAERAAWVQKRRVGRLDVEFLRDLHTRMVLTFTRLGFDDYRWYSDADLEVMITAGNAEVLHLRQELNDAEQAVLQREGANQLVPPQQREAIEKKKVAIATFSETKLKPFLDERERRRR